MATVVPNFHTVFIIHERHSVCTKIPGNSHPGNRATTPSLIQLKTQHCQTPCPKICRLNAYNSLSFQSCLSSVGRQFNWMESKSLLTHRAGCQQACFLVFGVKV